MSVINKLLPYRPHDSYVAPVHRSDYGYSGCNRVLNQRQRYEAFSASYNIFQLGFDAHV